MNTNTETSISWASAHRAAISGFMGFVFGLLLQCSVVVEPQSAMLLPVRHAEMFCTAQTYMELRSRVIPQCKVSFISVSSSSKSSTRSRTPRLHPIVTKKLRSSSSSSAKTLVRSIPLTAETLHTAAGDSEESSSLSLVEVLTPTGFPALGATVQPVTRVPNWGRMHSAAEWDRPYSALQSTDFVSIPPYSLSVLTIPLSDLANRRDDPEAIQELTAKLYYSTRYFGAYDLDSGEYVGTHAGVDLKLALGTPVRAIAGGRVNSVSFSQELGNHVIIEHRSSANEAFYSIYGHFGSVSVHEGQDVSAGTVIGTVGMTGNTSAPHLHLGVDRGQSGEVHHAPYMPVVPPSPSTAAQYSINPMSFIARFAAGTN